MKIAVIGSGGWGTAIAILLSSRGHNVYLWSWIQEETDRLKKDRESCEAKNNSRTTNRTASTGTAAGTANTMYRRSGAYYNSRTVTGNENNGETAFTAR